MKRLFARAFAIAAGLVVSMLSTPITAEEIRSVDPKIVIDGDTFYVSIRVFGIDAPEQGDRAKCDREREWAKRAKDRMQELLHGRVTLDLHGIDDSAGCWPASACKTAVSLGRCCSRRTLPGPMNQDTGRTGAASFEPPWSASTSHRRRPYLFVVFSPTAHMLRSGSTSTRAASRKRRALPAIHPLNEAPHPRSPQTTRESHPRQSH
jgi:hypothetical protein